MVEIQSLKVRLIKLRFAKARETSCVLIISQSTYLISLIKFLEKYCAHLKRKLSLENINGISQTIFFYTLVAMASWKTFRDMTLNLVRIPQNKKSLHHPIWQLCRCKKEAVSIFKFILKAHFEPNCT